MDTTTPYKIGICTCGNTHSPWYVSSPKPGLKHEFQGTYYVINSGASGVMLSIDPTGKVSYSSADYYQDVVRPVLSSTNTRRPPTRSRTHVFTPQARRHPEVPHRKKTVAPKPPIRRQSPVRRAASSTNIVTEPVTPTTSEIPTAPPMPPPSTKNPINFIRPKPRKRNKKVVQSYNAFPSDLISSIQNFNRSTLRSVTSNNTKETSSDKKVDPLIAELTKRAVAMGINAEDSDDDDNDNQHNDWE